MCCCIFTMFNNKKAMGNYETFPGASAMRNNNKIWLGKQVANRFDIIKLISTGGMGSIFFAFDNNLQKNVILKTPLINDPSTKAEITSRFFREVYCLTSLEHPFIVPIIYTGMHDEHPFIVSRYIDGGNLRDLITHSFVAHKPLTFASLSAWVPKIGTALTFMHANDWIHCDIKPDNILFDVHSNSYLTDFGISKHLSIDPTNNCLTSANAILGCPMYMAPEQHLGHKPTAKCDQYSLAVVIYESLSNKLPFNGVNQNEILLEIIRQIPIPLKYFHSTNAPIPTSASNAIMKALSFDPDFRHESIELFLKALFNDSDEKVESNATPKNTSKLLLFTSEQFYNARAPIKISQHNTDTTTSGESFLALQYELQKICDRILDEQISLLPDQISKLLKLLVDSEIFDSTKRNQIIDTLEFVLLLESNKTKSYTKIF